MASKKKSAEQENLEQTTMEETVELTEPTESAEVIEPTSQEENTSDENQNEQSVDLEELSTPPKVISEPWSVARIYKIYTNKKRKQIDFDIPQQRGIAWDIKRRSLYIHSVLMGLHVFQSAIIVNSVPDEEGKPVYKVYDGKQRCLSALIKFISGEYKLSGLKNEPPILDDDGEPYNLNGKKYEDLPDSIAQRLMDATMTVAVAQNASEQMMGIIFRRINNGKSMTALDISRSQSNNTATMEKIKILSNHILFTSLMKSKNLEAKKQEEMVIKTWIALFEEEPCFTGKHVNDLMKTLDMTEEQSAKIVDTYNVLYETHVSLSQNYPDIAKTAFNKTHFVTIVPYVEKFADAAQLTNWIVEFFTNMPEDYAEIINTGHTTTASSVKARYEAMAKNVEEYLSR